MRKVENECVGCPSELGCFGFDCPNRNVVRYCCDNCKEETRLYDYNGWQLCQECLLKEFDVVEGSDQWL